MVCTLFIVFEILFICYTMFICVSSFVYVQQVEKANALSYGVVLNVRHEPFFSAYILSELRLWSINRFWFLN